MRVVAFVPDLMDRSRFSALPKTVTTDFVALADLAAQSATADVVVVDLSRAGALDEVASLKRQAGRRLIGFGSHIDRDGLDAAKAVDGLEVLPRSRFFTRLREIVASESH